MAFAVAALRAQGETEMKGADAAVISFPAFFETFEGTPTTITNLARAENPAH
jgi:5-enolpyruvylshikimate-3-phosphate synthase